MHVPLLNPKISTKPISPGANLAYHAPTSSPPPHKNNFYLGLNCSLGQPRCETMPYSKNNLFGLCENAWLHWQSKGEGKDQVSLQTSNTPDPGHTWDLISESRMGLCAYKITHISAVYYHRLLNLVPIKA